jgi:hypothetical protein
MEIVEIHDMLSRTALFYTIILTVWAFIRFLMKRGIEPSFLGALVLGELVFVAQALFGFWMWFQNARPDRGGIHILYGVVALLGYPAILLYTRDREGRSGMLFAGAVLLFMVGIVFRGIATG